MTIKLSKQNTFAGDASVGLHNVLHGLIQQNARAVTAALSDVTNSSGGAAAAITKTPAFVNEANAATNLAGKATTDTALLTVTAAIAVLADKLDDVALALGLTGIVDNTGGVIGVAGTVAAVTKTVTAAATGVQAANMNTIASSIDNALYALARRTNEAAWAVGVAPVKATLDGGNMSNTLAAVSTDTGVAASPGVTKAAVDAALTSWANGIAALAVAIATICTPGAAKVLATA